jgi:FK506-binding protein 2
MNYTGKLRDGSVFDSSLNPGREPLQFVLGTGRVIQGWDKGLLDMCIGDQRELSIPYQLAYGENGMPPVIPPKAELIFTTELKAISGVKEGKDEL